MKHYGKYAKVSILLIDFLRDGFAFIYVLKFLVELIGGTLAQNVWASCVQFYYTSSVYCIVCVFFLIKWSLYCKHFSPS